MKGERIAARKGTLISAFAAAGALALAAGIPGAPVRVHELEGATAFLGGTFEGVRIDDRGALTLAGRREKIATLAEPFAFAVAALPDGWAVGTGNDGRVLKAARDGSVTELFDAPEPDVFALWADADGTLFAGTSPDGKVYRIRGGSAEVFFDPEATYIWAMARGGDGALWVATGVEGKLFRVGADGKGEVAWDSSEPHLRSLLPLAGGDLLIGTVGQGRVVRRTSSGALHTVYDSALAEVVALTRGPGGEIFAAVLASEASFVELEPRAAKDGGGTADPDSEEGSVAPAAGTRAAGASGPRSELVRILDAGISQSVWTSQEETLFALVTAAGRLWLGTGAEGRLYSFFDDSVRFETDFEERQLVGLLAAADGPAILTTNPASLYRSVARPADSGTFTGAVADAGQPARYGVLRWSGSQPKGTALRASFRFGSSLVPDDTWSDWSAPVELPGAEEGEVAISGSGDAVAARYLQYRVELEGSERASPIVSRLEISYRQLNQRPRIERFGAMDPGQILVPANFNPADQVYEPASPNRDGIFTTLDPVTGGADARTKTLWKRGMRTLRWRVNDPNGDELRAALFVRPETATGVTAEATAAGPPAWLEIARERKEDSYGFDATALPDGRYRFRLLVTDEPANGAMGALEAEEESEVVVIDHSPPRRRALERRGESVRLTVADDWNPLLSAEISVDAGDWRGLVPMDGLVDGRSEQFDLTALPRGARMVLLRVTDAAYNVVTFDLGPELAQ